MKKKLTKNLGLKILSFLIAIVVWIIIVNIEDPLITKKFTDIEVTPINENAITTINQVYTILEGDRVDISVSGKKSMVEKLRESDLKAYADLSALSKVSATEIVPTCTKYSEDDVTLTLGKVKMMKVSLEDLESRQFQVEVVTSGEVAKGYHIDNKSTSPNLITVSGAKSEVNQIERVVVTVDVTGRTSSFEQEVKPKVYDKHGDLMDSSKLTFSVERFQVTIDLVKTKEVILMIQVKGEPKDGYEVGEINYEPKTVTVAGEQSALDDMSYLKITCDITGADENIEQDFAISQLVTNESGVTLVDPEQMAAISIEIKKLDTQEVEIDKDDIKVINAPYGYQAEINRVIGNVLVRGRSENVKNLTAPDLKPYIDLSDCKEGTSLVNLQFSHNNKIVVLNKPTVNITLSN